jgi:hypothetical protein
MHPTDPGLLTDRQTPDRPIAALGSRTLAVVYVLLVGTLLVAIPVAVLAVVESLPLGSLGGPVALVTALVGIAAAPVLARKAIRTAAGLRGRPVGPGARSGDRRGELTD